MEEGLPTGALTAGPGVADPPAETPSHRQPRRAPGVLPPSLGVCLIILESPEACLQRACCWLVRGGRPSPETRNKIKPARPRLGATTAWSARPRSS